MVQNMQYSHDIASTGAILFRQTVWQYEVIWAEMLDNGTTKRIVRKLKKATLDFSTSPPTWGTVEEIDVATPSGLTNPIAPHRSLFGYDFENDEILLALGEWDGTSAVLDTNTVKLLAIKRDFSNVSVLHDDLLSLAREAAADVTRIFVYAQFWGYGGKIVGTLGTYADTEERSVVALYDGTSWSAVRANYVYDYIQERLEPIWDAEDNFIGWLTEGHGTNMQWIKYSDLSVQAAVPSGPSFTIDPIYDMINHKIIILEWGGATGAKQYIFVGDPDPDSGYSTLTDVTPTGTIQDAEGNSIDLNTVNKSRGNIFSDGVNTWLVFRSERGGLPTGQKRCIKVDLGQYSDPTKYAVIADPSGVDTYMIWTCTKAIDPTNKLLVPTPLFVVEPV